MKIIAVEGLDKSGKRTVQRSIISYLTQKGYNVYDLSFPRYKTEIGQLIWNWLHHTLDVDAQTFELLQAADKVSAQAIFDEIESTYDYVVIDRYLLSQIAYGCQDNEIEWVKSLIKDARRPDYTILLDVNPELSRSRQGEHGENDKYEEDLLRLVNVRHSYLELIKDVDNSFVVDANQSLDDEIKEVLAIVSHFE